MSRTHIERGWTPKVTAACPPTLIDLARKRLGVSPTAPGSVVVRAALASAAGVSDDAYPIQKPGPKPRRRTATA
jgi:hypothetical protein